MVYGREAERAAVLALLEDARRCRSGALIVRASAGMGKSTLLEEAAAHADGMAVLRASGVEAESELSFGALHQLIRPLLHRLGQLPPAQTTALRRALRLDTGEVEDRFLVSLAALGLLAEAAESAPLLCLVDDVQWLDEASAEALLFVARRLVAEPVVMLFAAREGEAEWFAAPTLRDLRLAGLDEESAGFLLARASGVEGTPEVVRRLVAATQGNPLALVEASAMLDPAQLTGAKPLPSPLPVSAGIERTLSERVKRLPDAAQAVLLVAAAEETGELHTVLAAAQVLGGDLHSFAPAERAGLVGIRAGRVEFRHPLVRSAVYQATAFEDRRAVHAALAESFEAQGEADRRAWHLAAAAVGPDPAVARELEQAAERAERSGGPLSATAALERAAELTRDDGRRARRLAAAARSAWRAGSVSRAAALLERARPLVTDPILMADVDALRGTIEFGSGSASAAYEILIGAAERVVEVDAGRALTMLNTASEATSLANDAAAGAAVGALAERLAGSADPRERFLVALLTGFGAAFAGETERGVERLNEAIRLAEEVEDGDLLAAAGRAGIYVGDDAAAYRLHARVVARARKRGAVGEIPLAGQRLALAEILLGRWSSASATALETLELARASGQEDLVAHPLAYLAVLAALRGDENAYLSRAREVEALTAARPMGLIDGVLRWARGALELGAGRPAEALAALEGIEHPAFAVVSGLDRLEAAVRTDPGAAERAQQEIEAFARATQVPWALARAEHARGLAAGDRGEEHFVAALGFHDRGGRPFERARTELAFGRQLRRARRRKEAREHLALALDAFEALGAGRWAETAREELRASGQSARRRDPSALDELTPQELQVARFVAQGLSNRAVAEQLFLSPRTIDFHLRNVFSKLSIASRNELPRFSLFASEPIPATNPAISPVRS